jgi:carboxyl-terminal processing protease
LNKPFAPLDRLLLNSPLLFMKINRLPFVLLCVIALATLQACKKENITSELTSTQPPATSSLSDQQKDTALAYSKDIYLWYDQIPASFDARSFTELDKLMTGIRQYSTETGFSQPVDRWSFAIKQTEWNNISYGIAGDFGINVFFMAPGDLRVKSVEKESPAAKAGVHRGWRITKVAGSTDITSANADFLVSNIYNSKNTSISFLKPDNTSADITLTAATYQENPIFLDTVYNVSSKKIGYLSYNSFLGDTVRTYSEFQRIFNRFSAENVNDVVVDLRYNGGGYVNIQTKLANYLVNASANGGLMMKQQYNDKYPQYNESTNFRKLGSLNLSRVFFIVSNNTASASELLINNLKPYMDVKLIGPSKTYGKPVGYFNIPVGDWYIFPVSFRTTNKNGEGNYFNGLALDAQVADGLDKDWGDLEESALAAAVRYITTGAARLATTAPYIENAEVSRANNILSAPSFKGAVNPRKMPL